VEHYILVSQKFNLPMEPPLIAVPWNQPLFLDNWDAKRLVLDGAKDASTVLAAARSARKVEAAGNLMFSM
jgi:hypothetical protein